MVASKMSKKQESISQQLKTRLSLKRLLLFVAAVTAFTGRSFLQEGVKQFVAWLSSDSPPALTYQIISIAQLRKNQLSEYANREFGGTFNLQLDDNIIQEYGVFKVRIRNDGGAIENGFVIEALANGGSAKILDLKYAVKSPVNKLIPVKYSFPNLRWNTVKSSGKVTFSWRNPQNEGVIGSFLYRSSFKEFGYGKFNLGLIKRDCIRVEVKDLSPGYYAVLAVGNNGALSDLSSPVRLPESLALRPDFVDAVRIDPSTNLVPDCFPTETRTYSSLKEAIAREGPKHPFIIRGLRADGENLLKQVTDLEPDAKIYYEDDLKFLEGKVDVSFPEGLDRSSELEFYFLTKGLPDVKPDIRLLLHGQPKLSFNLREAIYQDPRKGRAADTDVNKKSLTPKLVKSLANKSAIIFIWARTSDQPYKGIRVFRQTVGEGKSVADLGEEVYDGEELAGTLRCEILDRVSKTMSNKVKFLWNERAAPHEPPMRQQNVPKHRLKTLTAPSNLVVKDELVGFAMQKFYADENIRNNVKYTYTIYMYDSNNNYSYPIVINASQDDELPGVSCRFVEQSRK